MAPVTILLPEPKPLIPREPKPVILREVAGSGFPAATILHVRRRRAPPALLITDRRSESLSLSLSLSLWHPNVMQLLLPDNRYLIARNNPDLVMDQVTRRALQNVWQSRQLVGSLTLHRATNTREVKKLLRSGAPIDGLALGGNTAQGLELYFTPILAAVLAGSFEVASYLIKQGASVNKFICMSAHDTGVCYLNTPLALMVANNRFDAVEFLLRNRANPNGVGVRMAGKGVPDYLSSNPLRIAEDSGLADMTKVLRSYGASLEPFIDDIRFGLCLTESQLVRLENVKQQKAKEFGLPSNYFNEQLMQVT